MMEIFTRRASGFLKVRGRRSMDIAGCTSMSDTDTEEEMTVKSVDPNEEAPIMWPSALYQKIINPPTIDREPPQQQHHHTQSVLQPPKLDWRSDKSYRKVMGVMGGLGWMEENRTNTERSMLSFSPSDESHHVKHFKPLP